MGAAEYKLVVLGLIFLKYISDAFESKHAELEGQRTEGALLKIHCQRHAHEDFLLRRLHLVGTRDTRVRKCHCHQSGERFNSQFARALHSDRNHKHLLERRSVHGRLRGQPPDLCQ
ncbi:MAG: type I restriction-modification system subunit M N-terminal domain-containing protein [Acidobacteriaceae bacterium]